MQLNNGKWIQGTGEYSVGSINPPVESGQLLADNEFLLDDGSWVNDANITIAGGLLVFTNASTGNHSRQYLILTSGRHYRLRLKISGFSSGSIRLEMGASVSDAFTADGVYETYMTSLSTALDIEARTNGTTLNVEWVTLEEVPEGYPLMNKGDKFLKCTSNGTISWKSDQAYGEWEWKQCVNTNSTGDCRIQIISDTPEAYGLSNAYLIDWYIGTGLRLGRISTLPSFATLAGSGITWGGNEIDVWYSVKVTRTLDGSFSIYQKGGALGDIWTLVSTTGGSGTNPVTDTTHTESKYFVLDFDTGDRISNIIMRPAVQQ